MKVFTVFLGLVLLASISGCAQIGQISDDQLAQDLSVGTKAAVKYALQAAMKKYPAEATRIAADAATIDGVIKNTVIPLFSGASTGTVLKSAVDTAIGLIKSKALSPKTIDMIDLIVTVIQTEVPLASIPADKPLSVRTTKSLNGIFGGASGGIEAVFPPPTPAPVPAPVPPAPSK